MRYILNFVHFAWPIPFLFRHPCGWLYVTRVGLAIVPEAWSALRSWFLGHGVCPHREWWKWKERQLLSSLGGGNEKNCWPCDGDGGFQSQNWEQRKGVVGPITLTSDNSDNRERLVAFASIHDTSITNTLFPLKRVPQATLYIHRMWHLAGAILTTN